MIKFFRHIRRSLINQNQMGKYFKYAIGEILLVVIGILIALQINNWNEQRKENALGKHYLSGIKDDLSKDLKLIDSVVAVHSLSISLISSIDSVFHRKKQFNASKYLFLFNNLDTTEVERVFYRETSFRSIKGSYNSLIADGKSGLISNKELFQVIQQIYNENHERLSSTYEAIKAIELDIRSKYTYQKHNWTYADLKNAKDQKIFTDLVNLNEEKYWYILNLLRIKNNSEKVIMLIDKELTDD